MTNSGLPNHRKTEEYNDTIYAKRLMMVYIPSSSLGGWVGFADAATALVERLVVSWSCHTSESRTHSTQEIATIELGETIRLGSRSPRQHAGLDDWVFMATL